MTRPVAVVAGATGVTGRYLTAHLAASGRWEVIALSRRAPDAAARCRHVAVDLSDAAATRAALAAVSDATHVFYCAFVQEADAAALRQRNTAMLVNVVEAVEAASPALRHVHLVEGTKWYGSHLGPFTTPAKEHHPRHAGDNFYFDQQDWLEARQAGKAWTWSAVRPHAVCGLSLGSPMNLSLLLAVYASLCKATGAPFSHPGAPENWTALYQCTDSGLLARGMEWVATTPACANQAFNFTNGDLIRWSNLWPRMAAFFEVPLVPPSPRRLAEFLPALSPRWDALVREHGLQPYRLDQLAGYAFGDFVFGSRWDIISDVGRLRRHGFCEAVDTEDMFLRQFASFRAARIIP
jgi:nucleoside-diphosphate-sugar epimerase